MARGKLYARYWGVSGRKRRFFPRTESATGVVTTVIPRPRRTGWMSETMLHQHFAEDQRRLEIWVLQQTVSVPPPDPIPVDEAPPAAESWILDLETGSFWPVKYADMNFDVFSITAHADLGSDDQSDVILGGRDGFTRQLDRSVFQDDGVSFTSYVMIGPIRVGLQDGMVGLVEELEACLTDDSGNVTWSLRVASNYEDAGTLATSVAATGTWFGGWLNVLNRPRRRGAAFSVVVTNAETNDGWSIEEINSVCTERGMRR